MPFIGIASGFLSGLFGIGGGTVTVPLILLAGIPLKYAIGISSFQMTVSSISGTYINKKSNDFYYMKYWKLGVGGIIGGFIGANLVNILDETIIGFMFIALLLYAIYRVLNSQTKEGEKRKYKQYTLLVMGTLVGSISAVLGVGGGILLVPLLISVFGYTTKEASIVGLFFVAFTASISFLTLSYLGYVDFLHGAIVALFAILGVKLGIVYRDTISKELHKKLVVIMYVTLLLIFIYKMEMF